jgi:Asp-tRNA(Asn)/Glu-tRNA(Gln) amidotransferase C subunit
MDFHELAAKLLIRFNNIANGQDIKIKFISIKGLTKREKAAASYLVRMQLISKTDFIGLKPTNGEAVVVNERCMEIVGRFDADVKKIAEYLKKLEGLDSQPIDQSINIHGDNTGTAVTNPVNSPVTVNSNNNTELAELFEKIAQTLREGTPLPEDERKSFLEGLKKVATKVGLSTVAALLTDALSNLG